MKINNIKKIIIFIIPLISGCFSLTYGSSAFHNINYYRSKSCEQYELNYMCFFSGPQPNAYKLNIIEKKNYKEYVLRFYNINKFSISKILNRNIYPITSSYDGKTGYTKCCINLPNFNNEKDKIMLESNDSTTEILTKQ